MTTIITHTMSYRFGDLQQSPLFEHLVMLLVTSIWAKDSSANTEKVVSKIFCPFQTIIGENSCVLENVLLKLSTLRIYILCII